MMPLKHEKRLAGQCIKPLAYYRAEELKKMRANFFGQNPVYHEARQRSVYKGGLSRAFKRRRGARRVCLRQWGRPHEAEIEACLAHRVMSLY
jgi:hypothetical protein